MGLALAVLALRRAVAIVSVPYFSAYTIQSNLYYPLV